MGALPEIVEELPNSLIFTLIRYVLMTPNNVY